MKIIRTLKTLKKFYTYCAQLCAQEIERFEEELDFWTIYNLTLNLEDYKRKVKYYQDQIASLAA